MRNICVKKKGGGRGKVMPGALLKRKIDDFEERGLG